MTTPQLAQAFIKVYRKGEIHSMHKFLTGANSEDNSECFGECDECSLSNICEFLSFFDGRPDHITFLTSVKPIYSYIKHNYPEYLI